MARFQIDETERHFGRPEALAVAPVFAYDHVIHSVRDSRGKIVVVVEEHLYLEGGRVGVGLWNTGFVVMATGVRVGWVRKRRRGCKAQRNYSYS